MKRNPYWLIGTNRRFAAKATAGQTATEKDAELLSLELQGRGVVEHEDDAAARKRRASEAKSRKAARVARLVRAAKRRPKSLTTRARELGGISHSSWSTTWPGERTAEFRRALPGIFRGRRGGGMPWDHLASALRSDGYGPDPSTDAGAVDHSWLVDALAESARGVPQWTRSERDVTERDELTMGTRIEPRRYRRANPSQLLTVLNPKPKGKKPKRRKARRKASATPRPLRLSPSEIEARAAFVAEYGRDPTATELAAFAGARLKAKMRPDRRENPTPSAAAVRAFREFHECEPRGVRVVDVPGISGELIALGDLVEIVYRPTRGARRGPAFVHKFARGARVAATIDGKHLVLVPGPRAFRVDWRRGIIG